MELVFVFLMLVMFKTPLTTVVNSLASMFVDDIKPTQGKNNGTN